VVPDWLLELACEQMKKPASRLAAATQLRPIKPNVPPHDFMTDALPTTTLPIYVGLGPTHSMGASVDLHQSAQV